MEFYPNLTKLLDDRHVRGHEKTFSKLPFHLLCVGELEIIRRTDLAMQEREARLAILNTLCYHCAYLDISKLKAQYDATMKKVERGASTWSVDLAEKLHMDLAFRASVINRESSGKEVKVSKNDKKANSQDDFKTPSGKKQESKLPTEIKMHYCLDFNKGSCTFDDNHEGKFGNKEVTLFHLCCRCLLSEQKLKRNHPESDPNCPSRS